MAPTIHEPARLTNFRSIGPVCNALNSNLIAPVCLGVLFALIVPIRVPNGPPSLNGAFSVRSMVMSVLKSPLNLTSVCEASTATCEPDT